MTELKPCPFCGGQARIQAKYSWQWVDDLSGDKPELFRVRCGNCDAARVASTEQRVIDKWNTRAERKDVTK